MHLVGFTIEIEESYQIFFTSLNEMFERKTSSEDRDHLSIQEAHLC